MTERKTSLDGLAVTVLLVCCLLWGLAQVAAKVGLRELPPMLQASLRSGLAALLVMAWARWRRVALFARDGTLAGGLAAGALFAAEFSAVFFGLQHTAASRMTVFLYLSPFIVAMGMPFIAHTERMSPRQWAGLVLAFSGVAVAFYEGFVAPQVGPRQWLGDALGVLAAVGWGATTLVIRGSRLANAPPEKTLWYQLAVSAVLMGTASALLGEALPPQVSPLVWGALAFQIVIVTFASYLAWFWLMRHYRATHLASFTLLTPIAGLVFGVLLLHEPLTWRLGVALGAVVAGLVLVNQR